MSWNPYKNGNSVGQTGSENGLILRDDENELGARITLEGNGCSSPFAISCGIYGWMVHTRFFSSEAEAIGEYDRMKAALGEILGIIPLVDDPAVDEKSREVSDAISNFVCQYP